MWVAPMDELCCDECWSSWNATYEPPRCDQPGLCGWCGKHVEFGVIVRTGGFDTDQIEWPND